MMWQPIETAPRDATAILVMRDIWPGARSGRAEECNGRNTYVAAWWPDERGGQGAWICYMDAVLDPECPVEPTHWMPLPDAPGAQPAPGAPWVSLAERMPNPDKHDRVLIYTEGYDFGGEQVFDVKAEALNECRYIDPDEQPETCKAASHWMPHPRNAIFDYAAHCAQPAPSVPTALLVAAADLIAQMEIVSRVGFIDTPNDKDSCAAFCVAEGTWLELMSCVESLAASLAAAPEAKP